MSWSFRLARVGGVDVKVHLSIVLLLALGALLWGQPHGAAGALFGVAIMLLLILCVVLHELGHALAARALGLPVREILLLPVGGLAVLGRAPQRPLHELLIAAAGPLVNLIIVVVLAVIGAVSGVAAGLTPQDVVALVGEPTLLGGLLWLMQANIMLVLFNLLPAFPLDGGRMLRAVLWMATDERRATAIAAGVGQALGLLIGLLGLFGGNLAIALTGAFIFFGARQEQAGAAAAPALARLRAGDTYNRGAVTLQIGDRVGDVARHILRSYQPDFAVLHGAAPIGIVSRQEVVGALAAGQEDAYVTGVMRRDVVRVDVSASLEVVAQVMAAQGVRVVAVFEGDQYRGLISREDIEEAYPIGRLLRQPAGDPTPSAG